MNNERSKRVCPVENAGGLDNSVRRLLQDPHKIVKPFINKGMTVLDMGCGPGFFTVEMANLLQDSGKIIAADLQDGMLDKISKKIKGTALEKRIELHKCQNDSIGIIENVDFVLAFYMIHEVPDQVKLFNELHSILNTSGKIFIIEPRLHVSKKAFEEMIEKAKGIGFETAERPKVFFSRTIVLTTRA